MDAVRTEVAGDLQDHSVGWSNPRKSWFLLMVFMVTMFATVDRQLVGILLQPIKNDLHATDTQMGLLTGTYFSLFQVVALFPLARLADFGNRKNLVAFAIGAWSIATVACGLAQSYAQIAIMICLVAIGEAGAGPAGASLIADIFPPRARTRVFGLLGCGGAFGVALGVLLGGTLNDVLGWRHVFMVVGAPGMLFALVYFFTVREPVRPPIAHDAARPSVLQSLTTFWKIPTVRLLLLVNLLGASTGYANLAWSAAFFMRVHHLTAHQVGAFMSIALVLGSMTGCLAAGFMGDHLQKRSAKWLMYVASFGTLMMIPFLLLQVFSPTLGVAMGAFGVFMFFASIFSPCNSAAAMAVSPPRLRALASALATLSNTLGAALGPLLVGLMNDVLTPRYGPEAVRYSLAAITITAATASIAAASFAPVILRDIARVQTLIPAKR